MPIVIDKQQALRYQKKYRRKRWDEAVASMSMVMVMFADITNGHIDQIVHIQCT